MVCIRRLASFPYRSQGEDDSGIIAGMVRECGGGIYTISRELCRLCELDGRRRADEMYVGGSAGLSGGATLFKSRATAFSK
jgi:hypothetical protein